MKIGIMQPYWLPYIGYWQLLNEVDEYVLFDDVAYIVRGWVNRNNFLTKGEAKLLSFSLHKAGIHKRINEIEIADDFSKFMGFIKSNYSKAPHYKAVFDLLMDITSFDKQNLAVFLCNSIVQICKYLGIKTTIMLSSGIVKNNDLKGEDKVLHICKLLYATDYYNAIGGQELYKKEKFLSEGIKLHFVKPGIREYEQFTTPFVANLSIIDVMMFCDVEKIQTMLQDFKIV